MMVGGVLECVYYFYFEYFHIVITITNYITL